ncbi:hypothetical protein [Allosalinactinospora lopnorensis]|uniref:hypothetical protein n=1 Tax=Allosalinactinospora lopnorensis TaxID=1352348 RepID=UPI0012E28CED|nr:hypothetical protein [Allosalinactinospora lopnorensis]
MNDALKSGNERHGLRQTRLLDARSRRALLRASQRDISPSGRQERPGSEHARAKSAV